MSQFLSLLSNRRMLPLSRIGVAQGIAEPVGKLLETERPPLGVAGELSGVGSALPAGVARGGSRLPAGDPGEGGGGWGAAFPGPPPPRAAALPGQTGSPLPPG